MTRGSRKVGTEEEACLRCMQASVQGQPCMAISRWMEGPREAGSGRMDQLGSFRPLNVKGWQELVILLNKLHLVRI